MSSQSPRLKVVDQNLCIGCQSCMFACARLWSENGLAGARIKATSIGGMERGFKVIVCKACDDPPCARGCPTEALTPREEMGGVNFDSAKCTGCKQCVDNCKVDAVFWNEEVEKPMICKYCGYCAKFCPYGVFEHGEGDD